MERRRGSGRERGTGWHLVAAALALAGAIQACDSRPLPLLPPSGTGGGGTPGTGGKAGTGGTQGTGGAIPGAGGTAGAGAGGVCGSPACTPGTIQEFHLSPRTLHGVPNGITAGPDGNLWFTERQGDAIGRITTSGVITEFPVITPSHPTEIVAGPDGHLWFTLPGINAIGRMAIDGTPQAFVLPTPNSGPAGIAAGPDGNVWFTEMDTSQVGYFLPGGKLTEYPTPTPGAKPFGIVAGKDGNLWFTELAVASIGVISPAGDMLREIPASFAAHGLALGGDGDIWFTVPGAEQVGTITANGSATLFASLSANGHLPWVIARGPRGELWYTRDLDTDRTGELTRLALDGKQMEFTLGHMSPGAAGLVSGMTTGPDGAIWFTESSDDAIGRLVPP